MAVDEQYAQALRELATAKLAVRLLVHALRETPGGVAAVGRLAIEQPEVMKAVMGLAPGVAPAPDRLAAIHEHGPSIFLKGPEHG